jgi:hypothetical protein
VYPPAGIAESIGTIGLAGAVGGSRSANTTGAMTGGGVLAGCRGTGRVSGFARARSLTITTAVCAQDSTPGDASGTGALAAGMRAGTGGRATCPCGALTGGARSTGSESRSSERTVMVADCPDTIVLGWRGTACGLHSRIACASSDAPSWCWLPNRSSASASTSACMLW